MLKIDEHPEEYKIMSEAVETIFNEESSKSKIRGHDGYVNKARSKKPASKCVKQQVKQKRGPNYKHATISRLMTIMPKQWRNYY